MKISKLCTICKKEYLIPSHLSKSLYCGYKCYWSSLKGRKLSEDHKRKILEKSSFKKGNQLAKGHKPNATSFKKGFTPWNKGKEWDDFKGSNHPNWRGGKQPLISLIRDSLKYRQWRSDIFTRDKFICIICGYDKGKILEADHHPKMLSEILNQYKITSYQEALECEELWSLNNGRTLCKFCHRKFGRTRPKI